MRCVARLVAAAALVVSLVGCTAPADDDAAPHNLEAPSDDGGEPAGESADQQDVEDDSAETLPGEWTLGQEADPSSWRTEAGVAAWDGRIWVVGGFVDPDLPQGRHGIGAGVVLDDQVYVLTGGPEPGFAFSGSVYILDLLVRR